MTFIPEFLAFVWASLSSPHGVCVGFLFAVLIWSYVGVQALLNRRTERRELAGLNAALAELPPRTWPEKHLATDRPYTAQELADLAQADVTAGRTLVGFRNGHAA